MSPSSPTDADQHVLVRALVDELARCGLRTAVTSPGSRSTPLVLALVRDGRLRCHSMLDERAGGFLALGAAKASGLPVVLACTSGTAAAHYAPAVIEAWEARVPLIVLTADRPPELRDVGAGQTIDQLKLFGRAAKWFFEVGTHEATPERLRWIRGLACRTWWTAAQDRPGPVHLNLPLREPLVPPAELPHDDTGRPDGRPRLTRRAAAPADPEGLAAVVGGARRPMVVAGRSERAAAGATAAAFAAYWGAPLLADPLSGARRGGAAIAHYDLLLREDAFAAGHRPDAVVRIGDLPTSKPLRRWLASLEDVPQVGFDPESAWHDPDAALSTILAADPAATLAATAPPPAPEGWLGAWRAADADAAAAVAGELGDALSEPAVAAHLGATLPAGAVLLVASSMPVRDVEAFFPVRDDAPRVLANRGANGIDGTVATALGVAAEHDGPVVVLTGDVALVHDLAGLAANARLGLPLAIVLVDNGGGGIFHFLPVAGARDAFEEHVATPTRVDLAAAAALGGFEHAEVRSVDELVPRPGTLLHVRTDRAENRALHERLAAAVSRRARAAAPPA